VKCPRCTWTSAPTDQAKASPAQQLDAHAADAGHPLCGCCGRILLIEEQQTCGDWPKARPDTDRSCVTRGHDLLSGVLTAWADLHAERRQWPRTAMLGGGGSGDMPRHLNRLEQAATERWWLLDRIGPLTRLDWKQAEAARTGKEHLADNLPTDPPDIRHELERWEDDWRHERGEPAAMVSMRLESVEWWVQGAVGPLRQELWRLNIRRGGPGASVRGAADYLEQQMRWAARNHSAFPDFLDDMTVLHARLEVAVGRAPVKPEGLDIVCLDCGGRLQHPLVIVKETREADTWTGPAIDHEAHVCATCGHAYDDERLKVAKAETASRRSQVLVDGEVWQQVTRIAHDLDRSRQTIYAWVNQGLVRSFEEKGLVFAHVDDVTQLHLERPVRSRKQAS
jgi:hypothetical protein